jgi:hypothetical protein
LGRIFEFADSEFKKNHPHFLLIKKSLIFYVELIRLNRMSRQKKQEFLLSQPSGLGEGTMGDFKGGNKS